MNDVVRTAVRPAIARAVAFLLQRQSGDGAWRDFQVAPGRSDAWVTAYVGAHLVAIGQDYDDPACAGALAAAVDFLERARKPEGGWGYNAVCPPDADSTARVLLFLYAASAPIGLRDYASLTRFALSDGAFATYRTADAYGSWCTGHADVTAVALRALLCLLSSDHILVRTGRSFLEAYLCRGHLDSYWWTTRFYLAREVLLLFGAFELPPLELSEDAGRFELALACDVAQLSDETPRAGHYARTLAAAQLSDGSWEPSPILRVVDPRSTQIDDTYRKRSPIVIDDRAIFTTATAAATLARYSSTHEKGYFDAS